MQVPISGHFQIADSTSKTEYKTVLLFLDTEGPTNRALSKQQCMVITDMKVENGKFNK